MKINITMFWSVIENFLVHRRIVPAVTGARRAPYSVPSAAAAVHDADHCGEEAEA